MAKTAPVSYQKPKFNVYTMMMIISFIALVIACTLLWMEVKLYGDFPWWNTSSAKPVLTN